MPAYAFCGGDRKLQAKLSKADRRRMFLALRQALATIFLISCITR